MFPSEFKFRAGIIRVYYSCSTSNSLGTQYSCVGSGRHLVQLYGCTSTNLHVAKLVRLYGQSMHRIELARSRDRLNLADFAAKILNESKIRTTSSTTRHSRAYPDCEKLSSEHLTARGCRRRAPSPASIEGRLARCDDWIGENEVEFDSRPSLGGGWEVGTQRCR